MTGAEVRDDQALNSEPPKGFLMGLREWMDALIIAFVLAMFIRTFVVELFKIPSGSMSPTLLGDIIAEGAAYDLEGQSAWFLIIFDRNDHGYQIFRKDSKNHFAYEGKKSVEQLTTSQRQMFDQFAHLEEHRIFVNKFAYWFSPPDRGDIVVFRVPFEKKMTTYSRNGRTFEVKPYNRNQGVYVKRAVAKSGEHVEIVDGRLVVDGKIVDSPQIFSDLRYTYPDTMEYAVDVDSNSVLMFGDNTDSSYDSRFWGPVPYKNLRGKAFLRYWPWRKMRFLG